MERNQVTGIILITLIMLGYFMYVSNNQPDAATQTKDSLTTLNNTKPLVTPSSNTDRTIDSTTAHQSLGLLAVAANGKSELVEIENNDIKISFSTKGGKPSKVLVKKYVTSDKKPLYLFDENNNKLSLNAILEGKNADLYELYYSYKTEKIADSTKLTFTVTISDNQSIEHIYTLAKDGYTLGYQLKFNNLGKVITEQALVMDWAQNLPHIENDDVQSRERSTVNYFTLAEEFNNLAEASKSTEEEVINEPVKWISLKQKFFNSGIIASGQFDKAIVSSIPSQDINSIKVLQAKLTLSKINFDNGVQGFKYYFGPTKKENLENVANGYHKNLYMGYPVIREFNRYVVSPIFSFLEKFISNYGVIIIILGIMVKLLLLPLSFKSQVSMAKMRVMKPELDQIKEQFPDDLQKQQSEQMKLYQKVGINPLSGCVPVLLSMPVLLAMFSFFPNSIELRQQSFLWASDLSTYDAPFKLPFTIPFYGSHVSIFTLLMTISTLALTFFNNQMTTAQGPMKSISYIMPVVFMFVLNTFPAGLSFYYFVSNLLSIAQQKIMQQFVDEDKIKDKLEENRKKIASGQGSGKSKWMQRVEEAMKAREEQLRNQKKK